MLFILSGALIVAGVGLLIYRRHVAHQLMMIKATETSTVSDVEQLAASIRRELGDAEGMHEYTELKGKIRCDEPLTSELAQRPCVYYDMKVEEEYEETYYETDSKGNRHRRTRTARRTVAENTVKTPFILEDTTGQIRVEPYDAQIEALPLINRYEPYRGNLKTLQLGAFRFSLDIETLGGRRIRGYRYTESLLPLGQRLYVLGDVTEIDGQLTVVNPTEKSKPFLISYKSEEELIGSKEKLLFALQIGAIAAFIIGIILAVRGLR